MKKVLVATYHGQQLGQQVIKQLMVHDMARENIGYAVEQTLQPGKAERVLVTASVTADQFDTIQTAMQAAQPIKMAERPHGWMENKSDDPDFDVENFVAVDLIDRDIP